jgi:hypothetical protein
MHPRPAVKPVHITQRRRPWLCSSRAAAAVDSKTRKHRGGGRRNDANSSYYTTAFLKQVRVATRDSNSSSVGALISRV